MHEPDLWTEVRPQVQAAIDAVLEKTDFYGTANESDSDTNVAEIIGIFLVLVVVGCIVGAAVLAAVIARRAL